MKSLLTAIYNQFQTYFGFDNAHNKTPDNQPEKYSKQTAKPTAFDIVQHKTLQGGFAGWIEALIQAPLFGLKTRFQDPKIPIGSKFTLDPRVLYRGYAPFFISCIFNRSLQVGATEGIREQLKSQQENSKLTTAQLFGSAFFGGSTSGLVSGPNELIIARQTADRGYFKTLIEMVRQQGIGSLRIGLYGTMIRNGIFSTGYLAVSPALKQQFEQYLPSEQATLAAGMVAGACAAGASQPFDTAKTYVQTCPENMNNKVVTPMWKAAQKLINEKGIFGLYDGGLFRTCRVFGATLILPEAQKFYDNYIKPRRL